MKDRYYLYVYEARDTGVYSYCVAYDTLRDVKAALDKAEKRAESFWGFDYSVWDRKDHHEVKFSTTMW